MKEELEYLKTIFQVRRSLIEAMLEKPIDSLARHQLEGKLEGYNDALEEINKFQMLESVVTFTDHLKPPPKIGTDIR
jgi:hypothetical protein